MAYGACHGCGNSFSECECNGGKNMIRDFELPEVEEERMPLCCERLGHGSWCFLRDGHAGEHEGPSALFGPLEASPRIRGDRKGISKDVESVQSGDFNGYRLTIVKLKK